MSPMKFQGSASSPQRVDEIFTEYDVKINYTILKKTGVQACRADRVCSSYIDDLARVINSLYSSIAEEYKD